MAINALSSVAPLPKLTALQAKQITDYTPVETTKKSINAAAYASPIYKFDPLAKLSIEIIRDTSNGSVINQIPSEQVIQRYRLGQQTAPGAASSNSQTSALSAANTAAAAGAAAAANGGSAGSGAASAGSSVSIKV